VFDLGALAAALTAHGRVARVVIVQHAGSSPREDGASMLVWRDGQSGTIGGGALEWEATTRARLALEAGDRVDKVPLGPELGQCCGGAVMLLTEVWTAARLATISGDVYVRRYIGDRAEMPLKVANRLRRARSGSHVLVTEQIQGWFIEPIARPTRQVWVWGAGHVGRAIVQVLAPLPGVAITWIDTSSDRFPDGTFERVEKVVTEDLGTHAMSAPEGVEHLVLTYSHALDLELCHRLLQRGFRSCGLIGSATKWARFRSRLGALGHSVEAVGRIRCPIGDPSLGKHPQAIAVGVAAEMLRAPQVRLGEKRA
jgi:xanthine dehydrogenase accessory factor